MTLMPMSNAEEEYRRRWGWTDGNPGPVSLPKLLFKDDHARRLEAERDDAANRQDDAAITGGVGAGDLIGDAAGDRLADQGSGRDRHWFSPPAIGDGGEIVVTGRKLIPDSQKYVLVGGKYHPNPNYDPPFDISLEQAIAVPALVGMAGALAPEAGTALFARRTGLLNANDYLRLGMGWKQKAGKEVFRMSVGNKDWEPLKGFLPFPWHLP
ncbi:hypothetical protein Swit_4446 [Rhizorhabdus wittichii RW1]|uniref:Uncharacterized protein n=1 Tax=Rhizorhabdus wittichii (strain DSM 6014 / CCUG 31198 / JCM 15750 / NBRC 105917 / EY 4224 / RW1) TaxID=392499 RepID=A0A9J9HFR8_RHIWR|nr:hypothetical protein Swit_4446 [Rhizorhabdus wittichii RW1]